MEKKRCIIINTDSEDFNHVGVFIDIDNNIDLRIKLALDSHYDDEVTISSTDLIRCIGDIKGYQGFAEMYITVLGLDYKPKITLIETYMC
jgi:hypothetical protein